MEYQDPNALCATQQAINLPGLGAFAGVSDRELKNQAKNQISAPFEFASSIAAFNRMYKMESVSPLVGSDLKQRLQDLKKMLQDELKELDAIIDKCESWTYPKPPFLEIATDVADLMGDLQVFCASEMKRWNIPLNPTLRIIMDSNMSKLQEDGTALFVDGKLQKGPNYWQPEPQISMMLKQHWGLEVYEDGSKPVA